MLEACIQLCLENRFDPVVEYLDSLEWDGVSRIDEWLTTYLGAEDTELNRAIGRIALIAQVRRARDPGCKFDQIIVLESAEGEFKSTALQVLAGGPENFSDQTILGRGDQEQQELLRGVWLYEIADLSNIRKAEVEDVKAFARRSRQLYSCAGWLAPGADSECVRACRLEEHLRRPRQRQLPRSESRAAQRHHPRAARRNV